MKQPVTKIGEKFAELASRNEHALIGYAVAGYPDQESSLDVIRAMVRGGVDILELGIPFSDPIADGPTIQRASYAALEAGITPRRALEFAGKIRESMDVPLAVMTYCNILYRPGFDSFLGEAKSRGVDGVIIPDITFEGSDALKKSASKHGMDTIFLVSPNTRAARIRAIAAVTSGFIYLVSVFGTTGERETFEDYTAHAVRKVKELTTRAGVPLAVGFGVSREQHVRLMLGLGADAVIVGSAFINVIESSRREQLRREDTMKRIESVARSLKTATRPDSSS